MNIRSIRFRLILLYSLLAIGVSVVFAGYTYNSFRQHLYSNAATTLIRRAEQIDANILNPIDLKSFADIGHKIEAIYSPEGNSRFIRITRADKILYVSGKPENESFDPKKVIQVAQEQPVFQHIVPLENHKSIFIVGYKTTIAGKPSLTEMGMPTDEIESALQGLSIILVIGLAAAIIVMVAGGYLLVGHAMKPVEKIRATAEKITFGNLSNRLPVTKTGDALESLSITLNQMLERLEFAYQQARRFSADASHELRTPLAIMRVELESMITENLPRPALEQIGSVLEETEHLSRIIENLLAISRLDAGEANIKSSLFDLSRLVLSAIEQMTLLIEDRKQHLMLFLPKDIWIEADPVRIKQLVVNLFDNAIKYTQEGGVISVSVLKIDGKAIIEIKDNGIGIHESAQPYIFDRFFRAEQSEDKTKGAGLGLSIVKSIALAHGGTVGLTSEEGQGTTVIVTLPNQTKDQKSHAA